MSWVCDLQSPTLRLKQEGVEFWVNLGPHRALIPHMTQPSLSKGSKLRTDAPGLLST